MIDRHRAGPGRVVRVDHQGADIILLQGVGDGRQAEGRRQGERLALADVDARRSGVETEGARRRESIDGPEALGQGIGRKAYKIARVTQGGIARDGNDAVGDVDDGTAAAKGVVATKGKGAGPALGKHDIGGTYQTTGNHSAQAQSIGLQRSRDRPDVEGGSASGSWQS